MGKILVIGSTNMDIIALVDHLPVPGETVGNGRLARAHGGKGANQAVAAARAGGDVTFITCVGDDDDGRKMVRGFDEDGINTGQVSIIPGVSSGTALIFVERNGENCIAVAPGANDHLTNEIIDKGENHIREADLILLQLEIPYETIRYICKTAVKHRKRVILNPAPAKPLDADVLKSLEFLVLNETEAEIIGGKKINDGNIESVCRVIKEMGPEHIILTLGRRGAYVYDDQLHQFVGSCGWEIPAQVSPLGTGIGFFSPSLLPKALQIRTGPAWVCI